MKTKNYKMVYVAMDGQIKTKTVQSTSVGAAAMELDRTESYRRIKSTTVS